MFRPIPLYQSVPILQKFSLGPNEPKGLFGLVRSCDFLVSRMRGAQHELLFYQRAVRVAIPSHGELAPGEIEW